MVASGPTILYVEDNLKSRRLPGSLLRDCGFEVITTADPVEAIQKFGRLRFHAALIEYRMAVTPGPDLAVKMKTLYPDVPVVMLSGCMVPPERELLYVDAHFGPGTSLHDLLFTLLTLACSGASQRTRATAANWADST